MNIGTLTAVLALSLVVTACGKTDGTRACIPGASLGCVGNAGCSGSQVCNAEGTALGTCSCGVSADGGMNDATLDGGPDDGSATGDASIPTCGVLEQTGCMAGEDCSWVTSNGGGRSAECVPAGTIPLRGACIPSDAGTPDGCASGLTCVSGTCERVCSLVDGCTGAAVCQLYMGFIDDGITGVCSPTCDPVSQIRLDDGAPACGSPDPMFPSRGCYGYMEGPFVCTYLTSGASTRTHGTTPLMSPTGTPYANGCAPGNVVFGLVAETGETVFSCRALCRPAETFMGSDAQRQGVAPNTCAARGASAATEECRFVGFFLDVPSSEVPGVGMCLDPTAITYDDDMDQGAVTPRIPWPSCSTLTTGDLNNDGRPDHQSWGCAPASPP